MFYVCNQVLQRHAAAEISNVMFGTLSRRELCALLFNEAVIRKAGRRPEAQTQTFEFGGEQTAPQLHESLSCDRSASRSTLNRTDPSLVWRQLSLCLLQSPRRSAFYLQRAAELHQANENTDRDLLQVEFVHGPERRPLHSPSFKRSECLSLSLNSRRARS